MKRIGHRIFLLLSSVRIKKLSERKRMSVCPARKRKPSILSVSCRLNRLNRCSRGGITSVQILCQNVVRTWYKKLQLDSYVLGSLFYSTFASFKSKCHFPSRFLFRLTNLPRERYHMARRTASALRRWKSPRTGSWCRTVRPDWKTYRKRSDLGRM